MCTLFEEIARDSRAEAKIEMVKEMIKDNEPIEKIHQLCIWSSECSLLDNQVFHFLKGQTSTQLALKDIPQTSVARLVLQLKTSSL